MLLLSKWKSKDERNKNSIRKFVNRFRWHSFGPWVRTKQGFPFRNWVIFQQKDKIGWKQVAIHSKRIRRCSLFSDLYDHQYQTCLLIFLIAIIIVMMLYSNHYFTHLLPSLQRAKAMRSMAEHISVLWFWLSFSPESHSLPQKFHDEKSDFWPELPWGQCTYVKE